AGVNHQAWLTEWSRDGEDLYPRLREKIASDPELERRVRVEIFRRIGYYPTETSEHSAEYLDWFLRDDAQIERFRLEPLQYIGISEENVHEFEEARETLAAGGDVPLHEEGDAAEYAPQIIHSMLTGTAREIHVNVPNHGLIDNLQQGAVVEVPATVDGSGVHPIAWGEVWLAGAALNRTYLSVAELTIRAAAEGDPGAGPPTRARRSRMGLHAPPRRDLGAVRRAPRGARRPAAGRARRHPRRGPMSLVAAASLVAGAAARGRAVPAFNVITLEQA